MDPSSSNQSQSGSVNGDAPLEIFNSFALPPSPAYNDNGTNTSNYTLSDNGVPGRSEPLPLQTSPINSTPESSSHQRTASTESISWKDTDSILSSLNRKNKNLTPVFTRDFVAATTAGETFRKGWKSLSSLEKSLSVSLGVVSVLALALMVAVIVVGVQLNNDCQLVKQSPTTPTCAPVVKPTPVTTLSPEDLCNTTSRPRPPRKGTGTTTTTPLPVPTDDTSAPTTPTPEPDTSPVSETLSDESEIVPSFDENYISYSSNSCIGLTESDSYSACLTSSCTRMAARMLESIDSDTNPCLNFYQFACGGKIKNNPVASIWDQKRKDQTKLLWEIKAILELDEGENIAAHSQPSRSLRLAKQFYHSCMNPLRDEAVAVAELRFLLDSKAGGSSSVGDSSDIYNSEETSTKMARLSRTLASIRRHLNGDYIVRVNVEADDMNSTVNAIYLNHPKVGLRSLLHELGIDPAENDIVSGRTSVDVGEVSSQQKTTKISYFYQMIVKQLWSHVYPEDVGNMEQILFQIETFNGKLEKISTGGVLQDNPQLEYYPLNETSPEHLSPVMRMWLLNLTKDLIKDESTIPAGIFEDNEKEEERTDYLTAMPNIVVANINYFQDLERILNETDDEIIDRYLKFRILWDYAPHAGKVFVDMIRDILLKTGIQTDYLYTPRWETCASEANKYFGWTISNALIHSSRTGEKLSAVRKHFSEATSYLLERLNETLSSRADWISSNETRQVALRKLEEMKTFIGFPSEWPMEGIPNITDNEDTHSQRNTFVEGIYSDINFTDALNYMQNFVEVRLWTARKKLAQVYQPNRSFDLNWPKFVYPTNSKMLYSEEQNYFVLPIGVTDITLGEHVPYANIASVQYGSMGVLGAELILQGFDEKGSYRSESGSVDPWWDVNTRENFQNISNCFRNQYFKPENAFTHGKENELVISQRSEELRQVVLQNGALTLAYEAFQANPLDLENIPLRMPGLQEYSPEQQFFLSYAQSQCSSTSLEPTRENLVNNVVGNSVDFAKHWNCPLPDERNVCKLF